MAAYDGMWQRSWQLKTFPTMLPYHISGKRIVTMLVRPSVANFLDDVVHAGGLEFFLEEVHI